MMHITTKQHENEYTIHDGIRFKRTFIPEGTKVELFPIDPSSPLAEFYTHFFIDDFTYKHVYPFPHYVKLDTVNDVNPVSMFWINQWQKCRVKNSAKSRIMLNRAKYYNR